MSVDVELPWWPALSTSILPGDAPAIDDVDAPPQNSIRVRPASSLRIAE